MSLAVLASNPGSLGRFPMRPSGGSSICGSASALVGR